MGGAMMRTLSRWTAPALALPRPVKRGIVLALDATLCVLTVWLAFYLRMGSFVSLSGPAIWPAVASVVLALPIFITSGLYRAIFRYSGLPAMVAVARAILLYGLAFETVFTFIGVPGVGSLVVDRSKAMDLPGWKPIVSMNEQLKMMALHDTCI